MIFYFETGFYFQDTLAFAKTKNKRSDLKKNVKEIQNILRCNIVMTEFRSRRFLRLNSRLETMKKDYEECESKYAKCKQEFQDVSRKLK